jgi:ABC-type transport system involved in Fe-S cluster assembly fused permease/ATPase subunit
MEFVDAVHATNTRHARTVYCLFSSVCCLCPISCCVLCYCYLHPAHAHIDTLAHMHTHTYRHPHTHTHVHTHTHTHTHTHIHTHRRGTKAISDGLYQCYTGPHTTTPYTYGHFESEVLLHCCYTVVTLLLYCCYTVVTLWLHCCYSIVALHFIHTERREHGLVSSASLKQITSTLPPQLPHHTYRNHNLKYHHKYQHHHKYHHD